MMVARSFIETITVSLCVAKTAVSLAKVAIVVLSDVGSSLVCIRRRIGPKTLPCCTPASVFLKVLIPSLNST
jgi:hypothetical protein